MQKEYEGMEKIHEVLKIHKPSGLMDEDINPDDPMNPDDGNGGGGCGQCSDDDVCPAVKRRLKDIAREAIGEEEIKKAEQNIKTNVVKHAKTELNRKVKTMLEDVDSHLDEKILNTSRTIDSIKVNGKKIATPDKMVVHKDFDKIFTYLNNNIPVYLVGPTGVGKTHMAHQLAEVLKLKYYHTSQVTDEYQLLGFVDGMGNYQDTPFYQAFTKGGLFLFDELDASVPEALVKINMALANDSMAFPNGIKKKHKNFRVIAGGNTVGGADSMYTARSRPDGATMNRFTIVKMDYDPHMEKYIVTTDTAILFNTLRQYVNNQRTIEADFSTRAAMYFDTMRLTNIPLKDLVSEILLPFCDVGEFEDFGVGIDNKLVDDVAEAIKELKRAEA